MTKDYNVILDWLENFLKATGDNVLIIDMIHKKLNHWYKKIKSKKEEKTKKEKAFGAYNKQYKQRYHKCCKHHNKPGDYKCPKMKNEKNERCKKTEKNEDENKKFDGVCHHCRRKGHMSRDCRERK